MELLDLDPPYQRRGVLKSMVTPLEFNYQESKHIFYF